AQAVGAVHAAGVFAGREQAGQFGGAVGVEHQPTHHVVGGGHHFHQAAGQVEAAVGATLDHALELLAHFLGAQVAHLNVHAAVGCGAPGPHFGEDAARHDVARGTFTARVDV